jgi:hypothetical protein
MLNHYFVRLYGTICTINVHAVLTIWVHGDNLLLALAIGANLPPPVQSYIIHMHGTYMYNL